MPALPTMVVSDAHLGAVPTRNERSFLGFLQSLPGRTEELLINGDLFDFWFEYRRVIPRRYFPVLRRLADLRDAGIRVRLVGGNHDAWGGTFLREDLGLELLEGPLVTRVGGRRTYLAHGDGLAAGDWGYRAVRGVIRSRAATALFRLVHPDLSLPLIRRISGTPDRHESGPGAEAGRADVLSEHAASLLRDDPGLELVIFGHAHRPELREVAPGRHYLNPGDWIHHLSYALVGPDTIRIRRWEEDGEAAG